MKMTTIVIDDSQLQQLTTCNLINECPELQLVGSYNNPKIGLDAVNLYRPDLLILDVEMPRLDGFEVLRRLEYDCQVILYSTRSEYAHSAFQYRNVKDYLTKPLNRPRFEGSIERILKNQLLKSGEKRNLGTPISLEKLSKAS